MRRRCTALILAAALVLAVGLALPGRAQAADVCFLSVNDTLLELSSAPYFSGGTAYVPYTVFTSLGVSFMYLSAYSTAAVYNDSIQINFELNTGKTYDRDGRQYSAQAILRGGEVYLPAAFVCGTFGLQYSYLSGGAYGSLVRIKNSAAWLSDEDFLSAAESLMRQRYNQHVAAHPPEPTASPGAGAAVTPSPSPTPATMEGVAVYLCFLGMPEADTIGILSRYGTPACVFLTAEEILSAPDTVRCILGSGLTVGIRCTQDAQADYAAGNAALWEAACIRTLFITAEPEADDGAREAAQALSLVYWSPESAELTLEAGTGAGTGTIETLSQRLLRLDIVIRPDTEGQSISVLLSYLRQNRYNVRPVREPDAQ